jgi:hypothetical protein
VREKVLLGILVVVGACTTNQLPERDFIRDQWSSSIQRLGFEPVYPPSEDVQVGDIYAVPTQCFSGEANELEFVSSIKIASLDLSHLLNQHYARRYQFTATNTKHAEKGYYPQTPTKQSSVFVGGHLKNIPVQALPSFELVRGSYARVAAAIPLPFAGLFGAYARRDSLTISLNVPQSETYGLPAYDAIAALNAFCSGATRESLRYGPQPCNQDRLKDAIARSVQAKSCGGAEVILVSRAFSTREIIYSYEATEGTAFAAEAVVTLDKAVLMHKAATDLVSATKTVPPVFPKLDPKTTAEATRDLVLEAMLTQVSNDLDNLKASSAPGVNFSYGAFGSNGISLTQKFERPIVIGYAAVSRSSVFSGAVVGPTVVIGPRKVLIDRRGNQFDQDK